MIHYKHNKWTFFGDWIKGTAGTVENLSDVPFSQGKRTLDEIKIYEDDQLLCVYRNYRQAGHRFKRVAWYNAHRPLKDQRSMKSDVNVPF